MISLKSILGFTAILPFLASASTMDRALALIKARQAPGTPAYDCHVACGAVISKSRIQPPEQYCKDATYQSNLDSCLSCANSFDIWTSYGRSVTQAAAACGVQAVASASSAAAAGGASATATTTTASSSTLGSSSVSLSSSSSSSAVGASSGSASVATSAAATSASRTATGSGTVSSSGAASGTSAGTVSASAGAAVQNSFGLMSGVFASWAILLYCLT